MQKSTSYNLTSALITLALIISVGVLAFEFSPCELAGAQITCGDNTDTFTNPFSTDNLIIGATPVSGEYSQVLSSAGAGNVPEWSNAQIGEVTELDSDISIVSDIVTDDLGGLEFDYAANASYAIEGWLLMSGASSGGQPYFYWQIDGSSDLHLSIDRLGSSKANIADHDENVLSVVGGVETTENLHYVRGTLVTGASAGTFVPRWRQLTTSTTPNVIYAGSRLMFTRID